MGKDKVLEQKVRSLENLIGKNYVDYDGRRAGMLGRLDRLEEELKALTHAPCKTCGTVVRRKKTTSSSPSSS